MTTFDLADVRTFAAELNVRMDQCDNGEGMECARLDDTLRHYAQLCVEFCEKVREWGRAVFAGKVAFDPEVERTWLDEGVILHARANALWEFGRERANNCFTLEGGAPLGSALRNLERLLLGWVTPKLSVSPSARQGIPASSVHSNKVAQKVSL